MELHTIVKKLVGPVTAVGETYEDTERLDNLKALTRLVDLLLGDIQAAARAANRQEHSMKLIGTHAKEFLASVRDA